MDDVLKKNKELAVMGVIVSGAVLFVFAVAIGGVVMSRMWGWFVTPLGPERIGVAQAMGISLMVNAALRGVQREKPKEGTGFGTQMAQAIAYWIFIYIIAAVIHLFM